MPKRYQDPSKRLEIITPTKTFKEYTHKNSIYEGVQRNDKTYEKATGAKFSSFRRVSDKSDPASWIHTGIKARKLADKALQEFPIREIVDFNTDEFIDKLR